MRGHSCEDIVSKHKPQDCKSIKSVYQWINVKHSSTRHTSYPLALKWFEYYNSEHPITTEWKADHWVIPEIWESVILLLRGTAASNGEFHLCPMTAEIKQLTAALLLICGGVITRFSSCSGFISAKCLQSGTEWDDTVWPRRLVVRVTCSSRPVFHAALSVAW